MFQDQSEFDVRCEWGMQGVAMLAPVSDVVILVDVLSFTSCVDIIVGNGAIVLPYRWDDEKATRFAEMHGAQLAGRRRSTSAYSLAMVSLVSIPAGTKLVLPSPNGSTISLMTGSTPTFAGCLRNYRAVAACARGLGTTVSVIPAGERWADGGLRPAVEDLIGAGAIISELPGSRSPEAAAAVAAWEAARADITAVLLGCSSGKELIEMGFPGDVELAADVNCSSAVPRLRDGAYADASGA
ncbi:MAG: 2-phosphosulfolactate phosphatase [Phycisphaerales bacterium]|nr:2-phosphosulfolactate phosphatase [Phycisphaerales bacterium]